MDKNVRRDFIKDIITLTVFFVVIFAAIFGAISLVRSCNNSDPFEDDEFYNQSIGRQILMEKNGMYQEAEREKEMRRDYMRQKKY